MKLTRRDRLLMAALARCRYLATPQVLALRLEDETTGQGYGFPSQRTATRRLRILREHGYILTAYLGRLAAGIHYLTKQGRCVAGLELDLPVSEIPLAQAGNIAEHFVAINDLYLALDRLGVLREFRHECQYSFSHHGHEPAVKPDAVMQVKVTGGTAVVLAEIERTYRPDYLTAKARNYEAWALSGAYRREFPVVPTILIVSDRWMELRDRVRRMIKTPIRFEYVGLSKLEELTPGDVERLFGRRSEQKLAR